VPATCARLAWMITNVDKLVPRDGRRWDELRQRVLRQRGNIDAALTRLSVGDARIPRKLLFEGPTSTDCLIECEHALIWIEGKRFDWLDASTTWDVTRDQLARNVEAVWSLANGAGKDCRLLICHEHPLKHHEISLLEGYRHGTWAGGWPHVAEVQRRELAARIRTVTWGEIVGDWPGLRALAELSDLNSPSCR
jgi:hypothetical protein